MNELVPLDYRNKEHVRAAAGLHEQLLGDSPIPGLGRCFMEKFYYSTLVEDGLIHCDLYRHDGRYVAFSVYTKYPFSFIEQGKRRHFLYLCALMLAALISRPSRIRTILKMRNVNSQRTREKDDGKIGEYLSIGVLEEALHVKDEKTGLRIPNVLFERVIEFYKANHFEEILLTVKKDNRRSLLFWHSYGAKLKECDYLASHSCLMALKLKPAG